jgi:hypothetical protein
MRVSILGHAGYNGNAVIFNMGILHREWRELGEGKGLIAPYYRRFRETPTIFYQNLTKK